MRSTATLRGHRHVTAIGVSNIGHDLSGLETTSHPQMGRMRGGSAPQLWFNVHTTNKPDPGCRTSVAAHTRRHANFYVFSRPFRPFAFRASPLTRCVLVSRGLIEAGTARDMAAPTESSSVVLSHGFIEASGSDLHIGKSWEPRSAGSPGSHAALNPPTPHGATSQGLSVTAEMSERASREFTHAAL
jgi:hypothetical protein